MWSLWDAVKCHKLLVLQAGLVLCVRPFIVSTQSEPLRNWICCCFTMFDVEVTNDHRSKFSNLSNWKEEAWKNQGFNGIRYLNCGCRSKWQITAMIICHFDLQPQFKYMNYFIYTSHHFTPHGRYELNKLASLPTCGFIAQFVEHRTGIAEVTGSNPVKALIFSGFFFPIA